MARMDRVALGESPRSFLQISFEHLQCRAVEGLGWDLTTAEKFSFQFMDAVRVIDWNLAFELCCSFQLPNLMSLNGYLGIRQWPVTSNSATH